MVKPKDQRSWKRFKWNKRKKTVVKPMLAIELQNKLVYFEDRFGADAIIWASMESEKTGKKIGMIAWTNCEIFRKQSWNEHWRFRNQTCSLNVCKISKQTNSTIIVVQVNSFNDKIRILQNCRKLSLLNKVPRVLKCLSAQVPLKSQSAQVSWVSECLTALRVPKCIECLEYPSAQVPFEWQSLQAAFECPSAQVAFVCPWSALSEN